MSRSFDIELYEEVESMNLKELGNFLITHKNSRLSLKFSLVYDRVIQLLHDSHDENKTCNLKE